MAKNQARDTQPTAPAPQPTPAAPQPATPTPQEGGSGTTPSTDTPAASSQSVKPATTSKDNSKDNSKGDVGTPYNTELIKLDKDTGEYLLFNTEGMMKINVFFVLKADLSDNKFNSKSTLSAVYGREIIEISLVDDINDFGISAGMTIKNENGALNMFINNHTMYQVVVIISFQDGISETYKLEPYIFDVVEMKPITYEGDTSQYYELILESELTFLARTHHWVSVLKFDQSIKTSRSYEDVFQCILNYFKRYIIATSNKKFYLSKDLYFVDGAPDTHELVEATFKKIPGDSTIYEAIQILLKDACTSVWAEEGMDKTFQTFNQGAIYVPMFFRDEYSDIRDYYIKGFEGKERDDAVAPAPAAASTTEGGTQASGTEGTPAAGAQDGQAQGGGQPTEEQSSQPAQSGEQSTKTPNSSSQPDTQSSEQQSAAPLTPQLAKPTTSVGNPAPAAQPITQPAVQGGTPTTDERPVDSTKLHAASSDSSINDGGQGAAGIQAVSDTSGAAQTEAAESTPKRITQSSMDYIKSIMGDTDKRLPLREIIDNDKPSAMQKALMDSEANVNTTLLIRRHYFLRNMYMPFQLAFADKKTSIIYESFNPEIKKGNNGQNQLEQKEMKYTAILGYSNTGLEDFVSFPINNRISSTFWKNMVFCYVKGTGTGSSLIYFDWIYKYYHYNFLKTHKHQDGKFLNIIPSFYVLQSSLKDGIKKADDNKKKDLEDNYKDFCELNSNLFILDSEAPAKEIQFHIGKMLASFIILNSAIEFNVPGKLFRRPNEIIKVNKTSNPQNNKEEENIDLTIVEANSIYTDRGNSNSTMLYVRRVIHSFKNNIYMNKIYGNRIFDVL